MKTRIQTRPPVKQRKVLSTLRGRIVRGELRPGDRLPTRTQLEEMFSVSGVTIQRALEQLTADGFVYARGRNGTFVAHDLPHQTRYGICFSVPLDDRTNWRRFWTLLHQELPTVEKRRSLQLPAYYGIRESRGGDYDQLVDDLRAHRLAGLIFTSGRCVIPDTPLTAQGVPQVVLGSVPDTLSI